MTPSSEILLYLFCILATAFFAGMETGVISMNRLRLLHRARLGSSNAKLLSGYLRDPDRLLGTTLVGCNLMSVIISTLATEISGNLWGTAGVGIGAAITTLVLLLFGEFLPKAWFSSRPLERCIPLARLLRFTEIVFLPMSKLLMLLTAWTKGKDKQKKEDGDLITRENLRWLASDSEARGQISPLENLMIGRVLTLQLKTADEVMTPLTRVIMLAHDDTLGDAAELARKTHHMKFPVLSQDGKRCLGILYIEDVLAHITDASGKPVSSYLRRPFYIRPEVRADDVLPLLRRGHHHLAIVRNRSGVIMGIITDEGLLQFIAGKLPTPHTTTERTPKVQGYPPLSAV